MPTIRISDKSWERLKAWAEPLVDTADSALAKALDVAERGRDDIPRLQEPAVPPKSGLADLMPRRGPTPKPREASIPVRPGLADLKHAKLPQKEFREPLLQALYELGGSAHVHDLRQVLRERMESHLLPGDLEHVSGGVERWWNAVCWVRHDLVNEGYFRKGSPRGVWELSERGIKLAERQLGQTRGNIANHLRAMPDAGDDSDFERSSS